MPDIEHPFVLVQPEFSAPPLAPRASVALDLRKRDAREEYSANGGQSDWGTVQAPTIELTNITLKRLTERDLGLE
jgi:hypothetical protein